MNPLPWFAVVVRSRSEVRTALTLAAKGYEAYVPVYRGGKAARRKTPEAVFPGYVFCRFDVHNRLPVLITPGVSSIVSTGGTATSISDAEIDFVRKLVSSGLQTTVHPYLPVGQRVRVAHGALSGVEGVVVNVHDSVRLSVSIELLQRSISVQLDRSVLVPLEPDPDKVLPHGHGYRSQPALRT